MTFVRNRFVLHDELVEAVIYGISRDLHDLVYPVILSKDVCQSRGYAMRHWLASAVTNKLLWWALASQWHPVSFGTPPREQANGRTLASAPSTGKLV
jgi:hypothetical protein